MEDKKPNDSPDSETPVTSRDPEEPNDGEGNQGEDETDPGNVPSPGKKPA